MNFFTKTLIVIAFLGCIKTTVHAQVLDKKWKQIANRVDDTWFASNEAKEIAENVLLYQRNIGGWPKNIQMHIPLSAIEKEEC